MLEAHIAYWGYQRTDVVVITHHMPSFSLITPKYQRLNFCFASDCEFLMRSNVKAWIYGHAHQASSGMCGHTFLACNASVNQGDRFFEIQPTDNDNGLSPELSAAALGITHPEITQLNTLV